MSLRRSVLLLCALGLTGMVGLFGLRMMTNSPVFADESYWRSRIQRDGIDVAYRELRTNDKNIFDRHALDHAFGGALFTERYSSDGFKAIMACADGHSANGCFHEFIGRVVEERGDETLAQFAQECIEMGRVSNDCFHSLGHGAIALVGYEKETLSNALSLCASLSERTQALACYDGLFMEYNERNMLFERPMYRALESGEIAKPCTKMTNDQSYACLRRLPTLLRETEFAGMEVTAMAARIGTLCRVFSTDEYLQGGCLRGMGEALIRPANFDSVRIAHFCDDAAQNGYEQLMCRAGAAQYHLILYRTERERENALKTCEGISIDAVDLCRTFGVGALSEDELRDRARALFPQGVN